MDFPEILVILAVAFIFLGPEKMMEVATKLGEVLRKVRETWDEFRYQLYMESVNKKIMEETKNSSQEHTLDEHEEELQVKVEEELKEDGKSGTAQDAPDGASEGTKKQTD